MKNNFFDSNFIGITLKTFIIFFVIYGYFHYKQQNLLKNGNFFTFRKPFSRDNRRYVFSGPPYIPALIGTAIITNYLAFAIWGTVFFVALLVFFGYTFYKFIKIRRDKLQKRVEDVDKL